MDANQKHNSEMADYADSYLVDAYSNAREALSYVSRLDDEHNPDALVDQVNQAARLLSDVQDALRKIAG